MAGWLDLEVTTLMRTLRHPKRKPTHPGTVLRGGPYCQPFFERKQLD
jgi:hypothetical protein